MLLKTLAAMAVGLGGLAVGGQEIRLESPFTAPELAQAYQASAPASPPAIVDTAVQERLSVRFENAPVRDVVKWLVDRGVSLVIRESDVQDARVTVNLNNVPADEAIDALAAALGGTWEKSGSVRVFRQGAYRFATPRVEVEAIGPDTALLLPPRSGTFAMPPMPRVPSINLRDGQPLTPEQEKEMEAFSKQMEAFAKQMEAWGERYGKEMEKKFGPEFERQIEMRAKANAERAKIAEDRIMQLRMPPIAIDAQAFVKSLTPKQRELMKKQGHLKLKDLTDAQRTMLGNPTGSFEIQFKLDQESIRIRS